MDCQECNDKLSLYLDHELSPEEKEALKRHLEECKMCKEEYDKYCATQQFVCQLDCVDAPDDFHAKFMARFEKECKACKKNNFWGSLSLGSVAAAAMVLLMVVLQKPGMKPDNNPLPESQPLKSAQAVPGRQFEKHAGAAKTAPLATTHETLDEAMDYVPGPLAQNNPVRNPLLAPVSLNSNPSLAATDNFSSRTRPQLSVPLAPDLIRQSGDISGDECAITREERLVIKTPEELAQLWKRAKLNSISQPKINWQIHSLGAIFLGEQKGRGIEISVLESRAVANQWAVKYQVKKPASPSVQAKSRPFLIFLLPKNELPVVFVKE